MNDTINAFWDAIADHDIECSGISWAGFNLFGDHKSINEVQRLLNVEARFKAYDQRVEEGQKCPTA
jgi:hypothetical protein